MNRSAVSPRLWVAKSVDAPYSDRRSPTLTHERAIRSLGWGTTVVGAWWSWGAGVAEARFIQRNSFPLEKRAPCRRLESGRRSGSRTGVRPRQRGLGPEDRVEPMPH